LVNWALRWHMPVEGLLKSYLFDQFCGGTTLPETARKMNQLQRYGVRSTLDYAVEGLKTEQGFAQAAAELTRVLQFAAENPAAAFVAMKMTGIGSIDLMTKLQAKSSLIGAELMQADKLETRLAEVCSTAAHLGVPVLIDAEESWIQDYIDVKAEAQMWEHNRARPIVYTTVQMYRHDRLAYLKQLIETAKSKKAIAAVKLVRGAYLEKENDRSEELAYPTPMQPTKAATDKDYDTAIKLCLENLAHVAVYAGTHNEQSSLLLSEEMERLGISHTHPHVWCGQLYGMSDNITFNLARSGFNASKYLPYGPLHAVLPYLFRRAQENTSIAGQTSRELALIEKELKRRQKARKLGS